MPASKKKVVVRIPKKVLPRDVPRPSSQLRREQRKKLLKEVDLLEEASLIMQTNPPGDMGSANLERLAVIADELDDPSIYPLVHNFSKGKKRAVPDDYAPDDVVRVTNKPAVVPVITGRKRLRDEGVFVLPNRGGNYPAVASSSKLPIGGTSTRSIGTQTDPPERDPSVTLWSAELLHKTGIKRIVCYLN